MALKFTSKEKRDEMAQRLLDIAESMVRAQDQGSDGRFCASDQTIEDIKFAACVVSLSDVAEPKG